MTGIEGDEVKPIIGTALVAACIAFSAAAQAQSGEAFAKTKCLGCHAIDQKKVGRSFKEMSASNKGDKGAGDRLFRLLKAGKEHPKIAGSDAELKAAVQYLLKQ
jgi:cytochrome c